MQAIQFLEFMGGSNLIQAFPNYLIVLRFIRINAVCMNCLQYINYRFPEKAGMQNNTAYDLLESILDLLYCAKD